jgi:hypothetical protein
LSPNFRVVGADTEGLVCTRESLLLMYGCGRLPQMESNVKIKLKLNQNLWGLIVAYIALGVAEYKGLKCLSKWAWVLSVAMTLSLVVTTIAYTWRYCANKLKNKAS